MPDTDPYDELIRSVVKSEPAPPRLRRQNYDNLIERHARDNDLDPNLIRAIMHQESGGRPGAVSPKNARGLMQLIPATAARFGTQNIHDPDENIRGGARYLRFLSDRFNGNTDLILAGYNAGEGAVEKFGNKIPPYRETQNYVPAVKARYQKIGRQQPQQPDDEYTKLIRETLGSEQPSAPAVTPLSFPRGVTRGRAAGKPELVGRQRPQTAANLFPGDSQNNPYYDIGGTRKYFKNYAEMVADLRGRGYQMRDPSMADLKRAEDTPLAFADTKRADNEAIQNNAIQSNMQRNSVRQQVRRERMSDASTPARLFAKGMRMFGPGGSPISAVREITTGDAGLENEEIERRLADQRLAETPEVVKDRKEFGSQSAPIRALTMPAGRAGATLVRQLAGLSAWGGIAPNEASEYLNQRASVLEQSASLAPLDAQGQEIERGLLEKGGGAVLDVGFTVTQLIAMKKATGLSLSKIMMLETALRTSDQPARERAAQVAQAGVMGRALDVQMSRSMGAAANVVPTLAQEVPAVAAGQRDPVDAAINTAVQAGTGALLTSPRKRVPLQPMPDAVVREAAPPLRPSELAQRTALRVRGEGREGEPNYQDVVGTAPAREVVQETTSPSRAVDPANARASTAGDTGRRLPIDAGDPVRSMPPIQRGVTNDPPTQTIETQPPARQQAMRELIASGEKVTTEKLNAKAQEIENRTQPPVQARGAETVRTAPADLGRGEGVASTQSEPLARPQWQHRDFGKITEADNQAGVGRGRVRVTAEDGSEHVIQRPKGTGAGNQIAIPVRDAQQVNPGQGEVQDIPFMKRPRNEIGLNDIQQTEWDNVINNSADYGGRDGVTQIIERSKLTREQKDALISRIPDTSPPPAQPRATIVGRELTVATPVLSLPQKSRAARIDEFWESQPKLTPDMSKAEWDQAMAVRKDNFRQFYDGLIEEGRSQRERERYADKETIRNVLEGGDLNKYSWKDLIRIDHTLTKIAKTLYDSSLDLSTRRIYNEDAIKEARRVFDKSMEVAATANRHPDAAQIRRDIADNRGGIDWHGMAQNNALIRRGLAYLTKISESPEDRFTLAKPVAPALPPAQPETPTAATVEGRTYTRRGADWYRDSVKGGESPAKLAVTRENKPPTANLIEGESELPEIKTSKLAIGVEAKAIEAKLTEGFRDLPEYETVKVRDQAERAAQLLDAEPERAKNIAMGRELPPPELLPESVFVAVENRALKNKDIDLIRDLATASTLPSEATGMGQRIRMLAERNPYSAVGAIRDVQLAREAKAERQFGRKPKERIKSEIRVEVKKAAPKAREWASFLDSIRC